MSVDAGVVVAVASDEGLQVSGGFGQVFDMESHIFDEASGAGTARASHAGENARTDGPVFTVLCRVVGKVHGDVGTEG